MIPLRLLLLICLLPLSGIVEAAHTKELPSEHPVPVHVSTYIIDLLNIKGSEQAFTADIATVFRWNDPRLAESEAETRLAPLDTIWHPRILIANIRDARNTLPNTVEIKSDGTVTYRQRITGTFTSHLDLRKFPNDQQTLSIHFLARGYKAAEVQLIPGEDFGGRAEELTIPDWSVGSVTLDSAPYIIPQTGDALPGIRLEIPVKRLVGYYVGTVFASAGIIVCMAWLVFWIPPVAINPRISVSVTSMLTLIAHRFVIQGELPNLPYLTLMDFFLLGSTLIVLLGLAEVVIVFRIFSAGNETKARKLNAFFRWTYPFLFIALLATVLPL